MRTKLMYELNRNLTEEENFSQCLKTRMNWQKEKERISQKQLTSESFDNDNKLTLKSFFAFCSVFFLQKQAEERWKRLLDRHSVRFPK